MNSHLKHSLSCDSPHNLSFDEVHGYEPHPRTGCFWAGLDIDVYLMIIIYMTQQHPSSGAGSMMGYFNGDLSGNFPNDRSLYVLRAASRIPLNG
ncbi:MAG: hypothetical protein WCG83_02490 [Candidatus Peregrinibacteria bacterium]